MKIQGYDTAAILTLKRVNDMTVKGRRQIAAWLRKQAQELEYQHQEYAARFTVRYWFKEPKKA